MSPTACPAAASATATLAATVDFPTPPLPDDTATILPRLGCSTGPGGGATGEAPGGAWVARAGPAGSTTVIRTSSFRTPSRAETALRASRTSVAGPSRERRKVNEILPSSLTTRSRIIPADRRSVSSRGLRMRARAEVTRASSESDTGASEGLDPLHLRDRLPEAQLDPLLERDGGGGTPVAGAAEPEEQHPLPLVEIHHLHLPPVGGDVGTERVQGPFDPFERGHGPVASIPSAEFGNIRRAGGGSTLAIGEIGARGPQHGVLDLVEGTGEGEPCGLRVADAAEGAGFFFYCHGAHRE